LCGSKVAVIVDQNIAPDLRIRGFCFMGSLFPEKQKNGGTAKGQTHDSSGE